MDFFISEQLQPYECCSNCKKSYKEMKQFDKNNNLIVIRGDIGCHMCGNEIIICEKCLLKKYNFINTTNIKKVGNKYLCKDHRDFKGV